MTIKLQDKSLFVSYLQIYLKDYFGMSLIKSTVDSQYEISQNEPLKVTGRYTLQTYFSVCLFMVNNYPNEKFPVRWDLKDSNPANGWIKTPFDKDGFTLTVNMLISQGLSSATQFTKADYQEVLDRVPNPKQYFDWNTLVRYFYEESDLLGLLKRKKSVTDEVTYEDINQALIVFLSNNANQVEIDPEVVTLDSRIAAYFFEEVVTPSSDRDEIFRAQKLLYPTGLESARLAGYYDKKMIEDVKQVQQSFIDLYTVLNNKGEEVLQLPEGYDGFKVTGYIDPWTEVIIKEGVDNG